MNNDQLSISITKEGFLVNTYDNKMIMFDNSLQLIEYLQDILTDKELTELENTLFNVCKLKGMKLPDDLL